MNNSNLILTVLILSITIGCSSNESFENGQLVRIKGPCFSANSPENNKILVQHSINKDEKSVKRMINEGSVCIIPNGAMVMISGFKIGTGYKVMYAQDEWWVDKKFLEKPH